MKRTITVRASALTDDRQTLTHIYHLVDTEAESINKNNLLIDINACIAHACREISEFPKITLGFSLGKVGYQSYTPERIPYYAFTKSKKHLTLNANQFDNLKDLVDYGLAWFGDQSQPPIKPNVHTVMKEKNFKNLERFIENLKLKAFKFDTHTWHLYVNNKSFMITPVEISNEKWDFKSSIEITKDSIASLSLLCLYQTLKPIEHEEKKCSEEENPKQDD